MWLGKLTALDLTPLGWLGRKTSTQTNKFLLKVVFFFFFFFFFCRTCFSMGDLGVQVSVRPSVRSSIRQHLPRVSCERNSSYSFVSVILKFACVFFMVWFGYSCKIIFITFPHCEFSHFSLSIYRQWVPLVSRTPLTVSYRSFWNFACIFLMVWGCACGLDIILLDHFCYLFHIVNLVIFQPLYIDSG